MFWVLNLWLGPVNLLDVGLLAVKMYFVYMYFVFAYAYDYADWSSYLGCGLLI